MKLNDIKKCNTIEDLEALNIGRLYIDISHRGGGLGFHAIDIADHLYISKYDIPKYFGASCNYLGGGIRGAVVPSGYNPAITGRKSKILDALAQACVRAYIEAEGDMNNEEYEDGDTNWDAIATKASRCAGIVSAY